MSNIDSLELEREKLRVILSGIHEGVIVLSPDQKVTYINKTAEELTGYGLADVLDHPIQNFLNLLDENNDSIDVNVLCPIGEIDIDGVFNRLERVNLVSKDNAVHSVNVESRKMKEGSLINVGAILILENVSQLHELERMKVDFVSMSVHSLRTPITILKGFLSNLVRPETTQKLDEKELQNLDSALAGADQLGTLVENLLHLTELQQGKFRLVMSSINYEGLVTSVVNEYKPIAKSKDITLVYAPPLYEMPMLQADFMRIKEVLKNLIDNALKFTENGKVEISISKEEGFIHTTVKDTGKGIPQDMIHHLFTKFYRVKDPLEMEAGQGLGLYISKKIVDAHNGEIWVESIEGKGSVFHFTLPIL